VQDQAKREAPVYRAMIDWQSDMAARAEKGDAVDFEAEAKTYGLTYHKEAAPKTLDEFYDRFKSLCDVLLDDPNMFGYCYTQLTDIYQEQNGVYFFDRSEKFDMTRLHKAQTRKAAIED